MSEPSPEQKIGYFLEEMNKAQIKQGEIIWKEPKLEIITTEQAEAIVADHLQSRWLE